MKYELQIVITGFLLGFLAVALNIIHLSKVEKRGHRKINVWSIELNWFLFNSFWGLLGLLFGVMSFTYAMGALVQGYWKERGASAFSFVVIVLVVWGIYFLYLCVSHPSVCMGDYISTKQYLRSIKEEAFELVEKNVWVSEHWLLIGERFVPRNCLIGAVWHRAKGFKVAHHLTLYTVDGREVWCSMAVSSRQDKNTPICTIEKYATAESLIGRRDLPGYSIRGVNHDIERSFLSYIEGHKDIDLLNDPNVVETVLSAYKNHKE